MDGEEDESSAEQFDKSMLREWLQPSNMSVQEEDNISDDDGYNEDDSDNEEDENISDKEVSREELLEEFHDSMLKE